MKQIVVLLFLGAIGGLFIIQQVSAQSIEERLLMERLCNCTGEYLKETIGLYNANSTVDLEEDMKEYLQDQSKKYLLSNPRRFSEEDYVRTDTVARRRTKLRVACWSCMDGTKAELGLKDSVVRTATEFLTSVARVRRELTNEYDTGGPAMKNITGEFDKLKRWCPDMKMPTILPGK